MPRILVADDEANLCAAIVDLLRARGFDALGCGSGTEALTLQPDFHPDAVVLDVIMPGLSGVDTFKRLREVDASLAGVFVTAHGSVPSAVEAIRAGGYDYLTKPFDNDRLVLTVQRALELRGLTARVEQLEQDLTARSEFAGIVGRSDAIQSVLRRLAKVARSDATILLNGESGTGKELAARSLHRASLRANRPFVAINCGAIAPSLAETELFGHERGAFTDAKAGRLGRFEQAAGGTLFLDEIGDLLPELQVKLLRAIEEREIYRVGAERAVPIDVRLIAATNRDLSRDVSAGRFRSDLYWRLKVIQVEMPAMRDRREDLPLLVGALLDRVNGECRTAVTGLSPDVLARLEMHSWPGNVRELVNVLRHAVIMADGTIIQLSDLPDDIATVQAGRSPTIGSATSLERSLDATERQLIEAMLERFQGNRTAAARALGINRRTLHNKLLRYRQGENGPNSES